jgi:3-dehydroquinate dehydratase
MFIFFNIQGIVHAEFMPRGTTIKVCQNAYKMTCNKKGQKSGITDLCCNMTTLCHTSVAIHQFLADRKLPCILIMDSKGK